MCVFNTVGYAIFLEKLIGSLNLISLNSPCCNIYVNMVKRPKYRMEGEGAGWGCYASPQAPV